MEHSGNHVIAVFNTVISLGFSFLAIISIKDLQVGVSIVAGSVAIISGGFAIRYYYYATKKIKEKS